MLGFFFHLPQTIEMLQTVPHLYYTVMTDVCIEKLRSLFCNKYNPYRVQRKNNMLIKQIVKIKALQSFLFFMVGNCAKRECPAFRRMNLNKTTKYS